MSTSAFVINGERSDTTNLNKVYRSVSQVQVVSEGSVFSRITRGSQSARSSILTFSSRAVQICGATSTGLPNLDRWSLMFLGLQYKICCMAPPCRRLELWGGCWVFGKFVGPFFKTQNYSTTRIQVHFESEKKHSATIVNIDWCCVGQWYSLIVRRKVPPLNWALKHW
jgi:hypothetical protein